MEVESFRRDKDITDTNNSHKSSRYGGDEPAVFVFRLLNRILRVLLLPKPSRACPEGEDRQRLVRPREIAPNDIEVHEHHAEDAEEQRQRDSSTP